MQVAFKVLKWIVLLFAGLLSLLGLAGFAYQNLAENSDLARLPPPGRLVDVNGAMMHLHCQGEGSPTAVIEVGLGDYHDSWTPVQREASRLTRVCTYDRAGSGYSEPVGHPVASAEIADRLHALLQNAGIDDDLILIGASAGGVHVREYFRKYPDAVKAMILVDSSHEQQRSRLVDPTPARSGVDFNRLVSHLGRFGVIRLSGELDRAAERAAGSEEQKARLKVVYNQAHWVQSYFAEVDAFEKDLAMNRAPPSLGNLPLFVLSRGREVEQGGMPAYYTLEILQKNEAAWQDMQRELAALSTDSVHTVARGSGHNIHLDQPQLIVDTLRDALTLVRSR